MLTPLPGATPLKPGSATFPFFGVQPAVVDEDGKELNGHCRGHLVFKAPWPGMMRTIDEDHSRFEITYFSTFPGYYATGDRKYSLQKNSNTIFRRCFYLRKASEY